MAKEAGDSSTTSSRLPWSTPVVTPIPQAQFAAAHLTVEGNLRADTDQYRLMKISGEPLSAQKWLELAVDKMKAAPGCPQQLTDAARRLEPEMAEAFKRRECDAAWAWGSIKNALLDWGLWSRTRPSKS
jgi:hypothetical protein